MPGASDMTDNLLIYIISTLSPEKVDRIFSHLPRLYELLEESYLPYPQEPYLQIG